MKIYDKTSCSQLLERAFAAREKELAAVKEILSDVRARGDAAVFDYEQKFDGTTLTQENFRVSEAEFAAAYEAVSPELLTSLKKAIHNIYAYHSRAGRKDSVETHDGRTTGYVVRPVSAAGIYAPGGTAPLSSSVLMGVLPAKAAGVERIVLATPAKNGVVAPLTLVAAKECGVSEVYKMGGAQAIAALAYGTQSVKKVDVIAGPGNIYVTLAKKEVYGEVGIDMLAGPSEILIIADESANARYVAADVLSQAEHDVLARAILVTPSRSLAEAVAKEVELQLARLPRKEVVRKSIDTSGGIVVVDSLKEACALANTVAPEHLEICTEHPEALLPSITHAGAVFLGHYTPEPVGDYFAGPDHILPTSGSAKFFQVLNEDTFTRKMSVISYTREALFADGEDIVRLARSEQLDAHANAVAIRLEEKI